MSDSLIVQKSPYAMDVIAEETYFWCSCGRSLKQPLCDGSHRGSGITPLKYTAQQNETLYFCGCKQTKTPPLCDGQHKQL